MVRLPLGWILGLCAVAAALGLYLGARPDVTETQVIEAAAAIYTRDTGRDASDCVGVPGQGEVWIEVRCVGVSTIHTYLFDRTGAFVAPQRGPDT